MKQPLTNLIPICLKKHRYWLLPDSIQTLKYIYTTVTVYKVTYININNLAYNDSCRHKLTSCHFEGEGVRGVPVSMCWALQEPDMHGWATAECIHETREPTEILVYIICFDS